MRNARGRLIDAKTKQFVADPNATPRIRRQATSTARDPFHHIFPRRADLTAEFQARGINPDDFTRQIPRDLHIDIHRGGPRGGRWNQAWENFFQNNPGATDVDVYKHAGRLFYEFELPGGPIVPYPK